MRTILFTNQKGGVGKTTCCRAMAFYLAYKGYKVLIIDADPQGNLTKGLVDDEIEGLYLALTQGEFKPVQVRSNLYLLGSDIRLALLEKSLVGEIDAYVRLKELITDTSFSNYDFILLDTPPSLGILTGNALAASDHFIIPMTPGLYTLQGTNDLMNTISKVKSNLNPDLKLLGVIINAYDSRPVICKQIISEIKESFGRKVFGTCLSRTIKIEEAIASKTAEIYLKKTDKSRIKQEVKAIGAELLSRLGAGHGKR